MTYVRLTIFEVSLTSFWDSTLSLHHHNATVSPGVEFRGEKYFFPIVTKSHYKLLWGTKFPGIAAIAHQLKP
jgi:hypothetical protein